MDHPLRARLLRLLADSVTTFFVTDCLMQDQPDQPTLSNKPSGPLPIVTVRHRRCSASGTKLRINSRATSRFTKRSASGKSLLRPRRPRLECACARCNVPDLRLAPSRFSHIGFQYFSSASHTGLQDWAVDSMTTSSASCSSSHAARDRSCSGLLPRFPPLKTELTVNFHVRHNYGQHVFMKDITSSWTGAERVLRLS
jgi:hypothetical protein